MTHDVWLNLGYTFRPDEYGEAGLSADHAGFKYDSHGNIIGELSPKGFETLIELDAHNLFPHRVTNSAGHIAEANYDYRIQKPMSYIDANHLETIYKYDPVGRLTVLQRPGDNPASPGVTYSYQDNTTPALRLVREMHDAGTSKTVIRCEYVDGNGRPLQMRQQAQDNKIRVSPWLERNRHGLVKSICQPFFSDSFDYTERERGDPNLQIKVRFDVLGRPIMSKHPDGNQRESSTHHGKLLTMTAMIMMIRLMG